MDFPEKFICSTLEKGGYDRHIAAPYFRKSFNIAKTLTKAKLLISGLGFYELYINGKKITKGHLEPYISNSDHNVYFDKYDLTDELSTGPNTIGIIAGNGMQNAFGGYIWDFDKAPFRSSPKIAFRFEGSDENGEKLEFESDETTKFASSPIIFNDLRSGEFYDANLEIKNWNLPGFDDSSWENSLVAENPRGKRRICGADPILPYRILSPVSITKQDDGYLYDFGINSAGKTQLVIKAEKNQKLILEHGDWLRGGKLDLGNIAHFYPEGYVQRIEYTCSGEGEEIYSPHFTYFGFRYVFVRGLREEQATEDFLTYVVMNSALERIGGFECSNEVINKIYEMCLRSTLANFYYFPTDCPHREKNGWTGDASVSCEHTLLNFKAEKSYSEWLNNVRSAMHEDGKLPGIVPTGDWGYHWGNGPCWDQVLTTLPYYTYLYRGDKAILRENATAIFRYLEYLDANLNDQGLIDFGLGDWVQVNRGADSHQAPVELTNSIMSMEIARMAAFIFDEIGMENKKIFAENLRMKLLENIRKYKIDFGTMTAAGNCQTSQCMAIYYGVFTEGEKSAAFARLLEMIHCADDHFDVGMLGFRIIFHLLSTFGQGELAYKMIMQDSPPSYAHLVKLGFTAMVEEFRDDFTDFGTSYNHHFLGDVNGWFIKSIAGIRVNPYCRNSNEIKIAPDFIDDLTFAKAYHILPAGKVEVEWKREGSNILLSVNAPAAVEGEIELPNSYIFENGKSAINLDNYEELLVLKR